MPFGNLTKFFGKFLDQLDGKRLAKYVEQFRVGLHSESETGPLSKRKNALESEYFHKKNRESLEKLKKEREAPPPPKTVVAEEPKSVDPK